MQYALLNLDSENRSTVTSTGQRGFCPICKGETASRDGEIRIPHWYHLHKSNCYYADYVETPWHRYWKEQFPEASRERNIPNTPRYADVYLPGNKRPIALEFQNYRDLKDIKTRDAMFPSFWIMNLTEEANRKYRKSWLGAIIESYFCRDVEAGINDENSQIILTLPDSEQITFLRRLLEAGVHCAFDIGKIFNFKEYPRHIISPSLIENTLPPPRNATKPKPHTNLYTKPYNVSGVNCVCNERLGAWNLLNGISPDAPYVYMTYRIFTHAKFISKIKGV